MILVRSLGLRNLAMLGWLKICPNFTMRGLCAHLTPRDDSQHDRNSHSEWTDFPSSKTHSLVIIQWRLVRVVKHDPHYNIRCFRDGRRKP